MHLIKASIAFLLVGAAVALSAPASFASPDQPFAAANPGAGQKASLQRPAAAARRQSAAMFADSWSSPPWGGSDLVAEARRWIGTNPTGWKSLWCARFLNFVLERTGRRGTGSNLARSFATYGRRVDGPQIGAIAVMTRGEGGGHVGVVSGVDRAGNPIIISGNHNRRVAEAVYPRSRIYAYVMPM